MSAKERAAIDDWKEQALQASSASLDWAAIVEAELSGQDAAEEEQHTNSPPDEEALSELNEHEGVMTRAARRRKAVPTKRTDTQPRFRRAADVPEPANRSALPSLLSIDVKAPGLKSSKAQRQKTLLSPNSGKENLPDPDATPQDDDCELQSTPLRRSPRKRAQAEMSRTPNANGFNYDSPMRPRPSFSRASSSQPSNKKSRKSSLVHTPKDDSWAEPKCGWVDESTEKGRAKILRRQKDIDKGYESEVYIRYSQLVSRKDRIKNVHPVTPNKFIDYPRRSWDVQVRNWRRELHVWAGESWSQVPSLNSSFCHSSQSSDSEMSPRAKNAHSPDKTPELKDIKVINVVRDLNDPDRLASLLGHYDIDSRLAAHDESTMKAVKSSKSPTKGPTDFSTTTINSK